MKITNTTPFVPGWTVGFRPDGRELAVVAVKATYDLRNFDDSGEPSLAAEQRPLIESDVFGADPAFDAPIFENDFGHFKPQCDVLLKARAFAPNGEPTSRVSAGVMVGSWQKIISIVGERRWFKLAGSARATPAKPFIQQDISYDTAFGGTDVNPKQPDRIETFLPNPVGTGYCRFDENLEGLSLPTSEEQGQVVTDPKGNYRPMAFGPIGRNWDPRFRYAGTYDQRWLAEKLPYLPDDFDYQYFQAAPVDQRIPYPQGGEPIVLANLTEDGRVASSVPRETVWVTLLRRPERHVQLQAHLDTILIEPDEARFTMTWRASCPLDRDPFEIREIVVERGSDRSAGRTRAMMTGKTYYRTLDDLPRRTPSGAE